MGESWTLTGYIRARSFFWFGPFWFGDFDTYEDGVEKALDVSSSIGETWLTLTRIR